MSRQPVASVGSGSGASARRLYGECRRRALWGQLLLCNSSSTLEWNVGSRTAHGIAIAPARQGLERLGRTGDESGKSRPCQKSGDGGGWISGAYWDPPPQEARMW